MGQLPRGRVHMVIVAEEADEHIQGLIRRMHGKYGNQGLSIVLINGTKGYTRWNASGVLSPAEEAESLRTLVVEHLKLPVTFLVEDVPFQVIPDGRKQYGRTQWQTRLPASTSIIGRDGNLDMAFFWAAESEIEAYVKRAIEKSSHGPVQAGVETKTAE